MTITSFRALLLLCLAGFACVATADMPGLNHLLKDFQFEIPEVEGGGFDITNLICKDISVGNLAVTSPATSSFDFDLSDAEVSCTGHLKYSFLKGDLDMSLNKVSVTSTVKVSKDSSGTANKAEDTGCKASIHFNTLKVGGVGVAWIANLLSGLITDKLCTELDTLVNTNLTAVFKDVASKLDPEARPFVPGQEPAEASPDLIDWRQIQALNTIQQILPLLDINSFIDKATGGTGEISKDFSVQVANISTVVVDVIATLTNVKVFDLDTVDTFLPLAPHEADDYAHSLNNTFAFESLALNVSMRLDMTPGGMVKSPPYSVNVTVPVVFHDPRVMLDFYVAVNRTDVSKYMQFSEIPDLGCDLMPVRQVNMSSLELSLSSVDVALIGEYADLNLLTEQCVQVLEVLYEVPALEAFTYFFQSGPVRPLFDEYVNLYLDTVHETDDCSGPVPIELSVNKFDTENVAVSATVAHADVSSTETDVTVSASGSADSLDLDFAFQWQNLRRWPEGDWNLEFASASLDIQKFVAAFRTKQVDGVRLPTEMSVSDDDGCDALLSLASVDFSGGVIVDLMNRTQATWLPLLNLAGGSLGCKLLTSLASGTGNDTVVAIARTIEPLLAAPLPIPASPLPSTTDFVDWSEQSFIGWISKIGPQDVNAAIDKATGGTGSISLPIGSLLPPFAFEIGSLANATLTLVSLEVSGLDNFGAFEALVPSNVTDLSTSIELDRLDMIVSGNLDVAVAGNAGIEFSESFTLNATIHGLSLDVAALLAVNATTLMDLVVGQIRENPACALKSVVAANLTKLGVLAKGVDVSVTGIPFADELASAAEALYEDALLVALANYLAGSGATRVNELSSTYLENVIAQLSCPKPDPNPKEELIVWSESNMVAIFDTAIALAAPYLDSVISAMTQGTGAIEVPAVGTGSIDLGSLGTLDLELKSANVSGLNTIDTEAAHFYLLVPNASESPYSLDSRVEIGFVENKPLDLSAEIDFVWKTDDWEYDDDFVVDMRVWDFVLNLGMELEIDGAMLNSLSLSQLTNKCTLMAIKKFDFDDETLATLGNFSIDGSCVHCTGAMPEWGPDDDAKRAELARKINETLKTYNRGVANLVSTFVNTKISKVTESCEPAPTPTPHVHHSSKWEFVEDNPSAFAVIVGLVVVLVAAVACCIFYRRRQRRLRKTGASHGARSSLDELLDVPSKTQSDDLVLFEDCVDDAAFPESGLDGGEKQKMSSTTTAEDASVFARIDATYRYDCLAFEDVVPFWVRWGLPPVIVLLMLLLVWANTSLGAGVTAYVTLLGQQEKLPYLFEFTLKSSVTEMWNAGVYPLAILIAGASGGWPYLKLFLMLVVWVCPRRRLGLRGRAKFLNILELTGKWSLIDNYVLVMMCVSFNFQINQLDPAGGALVSVIPGWGFYGFLIATVFSMAMSHVMTYFHRQATGQYKMLDTDRSKVSLRSHKFKMDRISKKKKTDSSVEIGAKGSDDATDRPPRTVACTPCGQVFVTILLLVAMGLLILGSVIYSFQFHFEGAVELVLEEDETNYSLLSLGAKLPQTQVNTWDVGIRSIQFVFYMFAFVLPIVQIASLIVLWVCPLTIRTQFTIFVLMEVASSWSSLDVFIVSLIAALVEIRQFAAFIVGDKCDFLTPYLGPDFGYLLSEDKCFDVRTFLLEGCWVLFGSVVLSTAISTVIAHMCEHALLERMRESISSGDSPKTPSKGLKFSTSSSLESSSPTGGLSSGVISDVIRHESTTSPVSSSSNRKRPRKVSTLIGALENLGAVSVSGMRRETRSLERPLLDDLEFSGA